MKILPIFIPHLGCPFNCIYCNQNLITKSKPPDKSKLLEQLKSFCKQNPNKKQIAFFGGTFTALSRKTQQEYFNFVAPFLSENCSIRLSTRPDFIDENKLKYCRENGVATIELGIQSFSDEVLKSSARGYGSKQAIEACKKIQRAAIDLGIQLMPGLPGASRESLDKSIEETIKLKPQFVRIYPTVVLAGTSLHKMYESGNYEPLSLDDSIEISAFMTESFNAQGIKVIKTGLHSDIEKEAIIAGPYHESLGELVKSEILFRKIKTAFCEKTLNISPADVSLFKGFENRMLNRLKLSLGTERIAVNIDQNLSSGNFLFTDSAPRNYW